MIQYIGLDFTRAAAGFRARAITVDRAGRVLNSGSAPVQGVTEGAAGVVEVRPGEWVRAGSLALKDAFFRIPAKVRKVWGISFSGPDGWIALSPEFEPLTALRITPSPLEDFLAWLEEDPRRRSHIFTVLPPKDYFRYELSGGLATDVTQAEAFGLLEPGTTDWSIPKVSGRGIARSWLPAVFDSTVATGRISEAGIVKTGLPGGLWMAAGARDGLGPIVSAGDLEAGVLLIGAKDGGVLEMAALAGLPEGSGAPDGFGITRAPLAQKTILRRTVRLEATGDPGAAAAKAAWETMETLRASAFPGLRPPERIILDWRPEAAPAWAERFLQGVGVPAERSPFAGAEDPGTAFLAAIAQGAFRSMSLMARKVREILERDAREAAAGEVIPR